MEAGVPALAAVGTFIVTFLDSYEIQFRIGGARGLCATEGSSASIGVKNKAGSAARPLQLKIRIARVSG